MVLVYIKPVNGQRPKIKFIWSKLGQKLITRAEVHCVLQTMGYQRYPEFEQPIRARENGYSLVWFTLNYNVLPENTPLVMPGMPTTYCSFTECQKDSSSP